ncbi:TVP38/TMEM64 family protein [Capilliphycus salinus ALCB114379]|uniref:TVP38/TMEM64 family protein n=1 Tax=Capilliphycus salinus TaxID=2768948 RepID=UPI0039A484AB
MNSSEKSLIQRKKLPKPLKLIGLAFGVATLMILADQVFNLSDSFSSIQDYLRQTLDWIANLGYWGPVAFILVYILATVLFLPGSILTLGAGAIFGVFAGYVYVSMGSVVGATCAFLVGRYLARGWVAKKIAGNEKFKAIDEAVAREGWKIVGLTRLSPIFPFNLLNYSFGLTKVSLRDYVIASWIGMIPGTIMYVYLGSLAGELATLGLEERSKTTGEWILYGVGLIATIAVSVYVTKIARQALNNKISEEQN